MLLCHERVRMDVRTHTVKNSHTDMLKLICYSPGRFTGRTTSETLRSRLDTVIGRVSSFVGLFLLDLCPSVARASPPLSLLRPQAGIPHSSDFLSLL